MKAQAEFKTQMTILRGGQEQPKQVVYVTPDQNQVNMNRALRYLMHGYNTRGIAINDINWNMVDALDSQL